MTLDEHGRVSLLFGPSPIHPLPRLSEALGGGGEIWAARKDCNSGIAVGGNKVRTLGYLVADAIARSRRLTRRGRGRGSGPAHGVDQTYGRPL